MALNPIAPHLRRIGYDAVSTAKVSLVVDPGDELEVSEYVAAQLLAQSGQFKLIDKDTKRPPVPKADKDDAAKAEVEPEPVKAEAAAPAAKAAAKKAAAKKAAAKKAAAKPRSTTRKK